MITPNPMRPTTLSELADAVASARQVLPHGAQTKPALAAAPAGAVALDTTGLRGVTEYHPDEFVITALAGTPLSEVQATLAENHQYLPFDPPLAAAGATVGGAVAAGINGPCRVRYGGVRDFVIGATFADGTGRLIRSGGKVIKNVAGFDYAKLLAGSCGRLAALGEVTFKVFPAPDDFMSIAFDLGHIDTAIDAVEVLARSPLEPHGLDIEPPGRVHLRIGGAFNALSAAAARAETLIAAPATRTWGGAEPDHWARTRDFAWAKGAELLLRIPTTSRQLSDLDFALGRIDAKRRYSCSCNVAHAALPARALPAFAEELTKLHLSALVLWGKVEHLRIGHLPALDAEARVKAALDPDGRFPGFSPGVPNSPNPRT